MNLVFFKQLKVHFSPLSFKKIRFWPPMKREKMTEVTPCLGKYALLTKFHYDLLTPYLLQKLRLWPLFCDMWRLLSNFGTKGAKIVIFFNKGTKSQLFKT